MAKYRQIHVRIWQDKKVEELSPLGKLLFVYSWSNTYRNEACLYELTKRKITNETGIDIKAVDEVLAELERAGLIRYDHENSYIWVINALKYQSINVNNMTAILRDIHTCKSSLAVDFAEYYRDLIQSYIDKYSMPWVWDDNGVPTPCESHTGKGKGNGKGKGKDNTKNKKYPPESTEYQLAEYLFEKIQENNPTCKKPNLQKWAAGMDKILRIDRRPPAEVKEIITFAQRDSFWCSNILSPDSLRKQYDRLKLQMRNNLTRASPKAKNNTSNDPLGLKAEIF